MDEMEYDDGLIACSGEALVIRKFGPLLRARRIPYAEVRNVRERPLGGFSGRYRIWGSTDFRHWYNYDSKRPGKQTALVITPNKGWLRPVITPDDPARVLAVLRSHGVTLVDDSEG